MSGKAKVLCKWDKPSLKKSKKLKKISSDPQFICRKCDRVAIDKKYLCDPHKNKH